MNIIAALKRFNTTINRWLTAPEPNAAGRLGLFRIVFAAFYLWHLSARVIADLAQLPATYDQRLLVVAWAPLHPLPVWCLHLVEAVLITTLVLLLVGYRTRLATVAVLFLGCSYEAWYVSVNPERASVVLVFFIPFFMALSGRWGATYSLDAHLRSRAGVPPVAPSDESWQYFLAPRAVLVVLASLFLSAAAFKILPGGTWLENTHRFANVLLDRNIKAAMLELPLNPIAPFIAQTPLLHVPLQYSIVTFEGLFVLALCGRRIRNLILSTALIFNAVNALWLVVTFTPLLIAYGLFVDWQQLRVRLLPGRVGLVDRLPAGLLVGGTIALAVTMGVLWNVGSGLRQVLGFGGLLDWRTIWYVVLPFAVLWWLRSVTDLVWRVWLGVRRHGLRRQTARDAGSEYPTPVH